MTTTGKEYAARLAGTGMSIAVADLIDMALADARAEAAVDAAVLIDTSDGKSVCTGCGADVTEHHTWEDCAARMLADNIVPMVDAPKERGLKPSQKLCQQCGAVVDEYAPHTWKDCAEALWTDYECENGHRCEVEAALQEAHEALKGAVGQRDSALDYIDHVNTCARCDGALMGPQPEDHPAHCEDCHPDEFEAEKWHEEHKRLKGLVEAAMAERDHERRPMAEVLRIQDERPTLKAVRDEWEQSIKERWPETEGPKS
jgi:hypothetical protein